MKFFHLIKWIVAAALVILGIFLRRTVHGHSFLGLVCFAIAGVIVCYGLIGVLAVNYKEAARLAKTALTSLLCLGCLVYAITEVIIIRASFGAPETACKYVVVLGAKVNGTAPSVSLQDRIHAAYDYLTRHPNAVAVLSGGQGEDEGISEARCLQRELTAMGISPERLWLEEKSTSTWENLNFSLDIIEEKTGMRPDSIGLISSEYHLFRAGLFAKDCGVEAIGIPAATSWPSIRLNYFLREGAGVWHYLILGGNYHD